jgi:hypothetical protein
MDGGLDRLAVFIPTLSIVIVFLLNQAVAHRRTSFQSSRDARGLRTALLSELVLLKALIAENLALINRGEEYLLSCRMLTQIYRGNVGRLILLPEGEIKVIVAAYGASETVETFIAASTKPHGAQAYRLWLDDASWKDIGRRLRSALDAVEAAVDQLEPLVAALVHEYGVGCERDGWRS